jgi:hypothetical protein
VTELKIELVFLSLQMQGHYHCPGFPESIPHTCVDDITVTVMEALNKLLLEEFHWMEARATAKLAILDS